MQLRDADRVRVGSDLPDAGVRLFGRRLQWRDLHLRRSGMQPRPKLPARDL
jgi:hypothetical protein